MFRLFLHTQRTEYHSTLFFCFTHLLLFMCTTTGLPYSVRLRKKKMFHNAQSLFVDFLIKFSTTARLLWPLRVKDMQSKQTSDSSVSQPSSSLRQSSDLSWVCPGALLHSVSCPAVLYPILPCYSQYWSINKQNQLTIQTWIAINCYLQQQW